LVWQQKNLSYWSACVIPPESLAKLTLRQKGVVLDSLIEDRAAALAAGASGEGASILQQIKSLQGRLSKIVFEKGREKEASKMQDEIGVLQRSLVSKFLGRDGLRASATITMDEVASRLAGGSLLIDFIQFADPKLKGDEAWCYGAVLTTEKNQSSFVRIDGGKDIDRAIDALRVAINQGDDQAVEAQTRFLSQKLWEPLAKNIPPETAKLVLCPDANLNFLSFAALLDGNRRFLAEKYQVAYIGSARDLVRPTSARQDKTLALFANPLFDASQPAANTKDMLAMRSLEADVYGMVSLPALPATEKEAGMLGGLASDSGWNAKISLGSRATEQAVRGVKRPGILHLATHGFYLASYSPPGPNDSRGMSVVGFQETAEEKNKKGVDPMRASGVALTGAQQTLKSWSQMKAPDPENDGILTAEEVGALDLTGTWLVTLSACETGVGEARSGEGVFGLRRAFMIAGAENLLMTLWPVNDASTADFMADFYREALASGDAPGALAEVQREWLVRLRNQKGLLAAVRDAGPFVMATTGRPNRFTQFSKKPDFGFIK
jgi:CHAT domain-containing protein